MIQDEESFEWPLEDPLRCLAIRFVSLSLEKVAFEKLGLNIYDDDEEDGELEFFQLLRAAFLKEEVRTVEEPDDRTPGQKVIDEIAATPATLYCPPEALEKLNKLCEPHGWTPSRLVHEAVKSRYARWDELSKLVMTPLKEGEVEMGPWGAMEQSWNAFHNAEHFYRPASRRKRLGEHIKGGRRDAGRKMCWTKPLPRAWPVGIDSRLDLGQGSHVGRRNGHVQCFVGSRSVRCV